MAESFIAIPPDSTGKKLRSEELVVGLNTVHQEVLTLALSNGDLVPGTLADGFLVNLGANNDVTVAGVSTLAEQQTQTTSLSVIDDWDEADRAKVNPIVGQAGVAAGAGIVGGSTQRVTLASDDPAVISLATIDDWDESDRAKTNPIVGQAGVQGGSGIITANTQRVVIATDQPPIPVTGGGGGIQYTEGDTDPTIVGTAIMWEDAGDTLRPVSAATPLPISAGSLPLPTGAATAANQATEIASLSVLDDWDESDRAKVNPIVGQAGVQGGSGLITATTQRVVIASDQPAIPVSGAGGTEYAEDTPAGAGDIGVFALTKRQDAPAADVDTDGDRARLTVDAFNRLWTNPSSVTQPISAAALPLPAGAATSAAQLPDGHNVTANAGTNLNTSALALEAGGNLAAAAASLSVLDDWDETDRAKVNPIVGQAGVAGGTGLVGATTQRVTLATDVGLPAGTNNIGDVDIATLPNEGQQTMAGSISVAIASDQSAVPVSGTVNIGTFPDNEPFNVAQWGGSGVTGGAGAVATGTPRVTLASDDPAVASLAIIDDWNETNRAKVNIISGQAGITAGAGVVAGNTPRVTHASDDPVVTALQIMDDWDNGASDGASVSGDVAHDSADAGEPVKVGGVAVSGSASPTSVASGDRTRFIANQHGIPYHIAGHPNLITREYDFGASAQTNVNLAAAVVAADERIYVTRFSALNDNATTATGVSVRAGFGTANVPTASATGVSGMIATHPGLAPGSGIIEGTGAGVIAVGAAGEEPRLTSSDATGGNLHVLISYFLIDETP